MTQFHAVMIGECGEEFGVDIEAKDKAEAYFLLRESYPESRVDQCESFAEAAQREDAMHAHIARGGDWDDEGRPIYPAGYDYCPEDDDWDDEDYDVND